MKLSMTCPLMLTKRYYNNFFDTLNNGKLLKTFEHTPNLHASGVQEAPVGAPSWQYDKFLKLNSPTYQTI
jgi:hypothetical protein